MTNKRLSVSCGNVGYPVLGHLLVSRVGDVSDQLLIASLVKEESPTLDMKMLRQQFKFQPLHCVSTFQCETKISLYERGGNW